MRRVSNSTNDQTAGYLATKVQAGANISLTTVNPGGDEKLQIDATVPPDTNDKVKATTLDTTTEYLDDKIQVTGAVTKSVVDKGGGNLAVNLDVTLPPDSDILVKATALDTTAEYLDDKIVAGTNITKTVVDKGGGNLAVQIDAAGGGSIPNPVDITALCTFVGWSSTDPSTRVIKSVVGKRIIIDFFVNGTPNSAVAAINVPDTASSLTGLPLWNTAVAGNEEGSNIPTACRAYIVAGTAQIGVDTNWSGAGWTAVVSKAIFGTIEYFID